MKNKLISVILLILIIAGIFSVNSYAAFTINGRKIESDGELAWYAYKNGSTVFSASRSTFLNKTIVGGSYKGTGDSVEWSAIRRKSGACLAHTKSTLKGRSYRITDVLDINFNEMHTVNDKTYTSDNAKKWINAMAYATYYRYGADTNMNNTNAAGQSRLVIQKIFYTGFYSTVKDQLSSTFKKIYDTAEDKTTALSSNGTTIYETAIEYGETAANYQEVKFDENLDKTLEVKTENGSTYIGPLKATFAGKKLASFEVVTEGTNETIKISCNEYGTWSGGGWATKNADETFKNQTGHIVSGTQFYLKINKEISGVKSIKVTQQSFTKYISRILLLGNPRKGGQELAIFVAKQQVYTATDIIKIDTRSVKIIKTDADTGVALNAGFKVYYEENNAKKYVVSTDGVISYTDIEADATIFYTSSTTGQITIGGLLLNKTYYAKEVVAPSGYKLELQETTEKAEDENKEIKFTNKKYGDLLILKVDKESDKGIDGIGFTIKAPNGKYIKSYKETGKITTLEYVENENEVPYIFYTDTNGQIKLLNIPTGTYRYEEDRESMTKRGYKFETDSNGNEIVVQGDIEVTGNGANISERFGSVVKNIFNSSYVRSEIVKAGWTETTGWTDVELASKIYNSLTGKEFKTKDNYDLLINSMLGSTNDVLTSLYGADRYDTCAQIFDIAYANTSKESIENLVLFCTVNNNLTDAVVGTTLASALNAPILLVKEDSIEDTISNRIKQLNKETNIYMVGASAIIFGDGTYEKTVGNITTKLLENGYTNVHHVWRSWK